MLYEPARKKRLFAVGTLYSQIDETSLQNVLEAFEKRIDQWYMEPIRLLRSQPGQHGAFAAMSICCLLIDCLCQFEAGKVVANRTLYKKYIQKRLPHYDRPIDPPIVFPKIDSRACDYQRNASGDIRTQNIQNVSEALYSVFRCGILHSAHAPLCGVISGHNTRRFSVGKKSLAKYGEIGTEGEPCPVVVIDPWKLFDEIERAFQDHLARIRSAKPTAAVRKRFNTKFADCFGIDVSSAR